LLKLYQFSALHVEDNPASVPQTSKGIVEMKPAENSTSTNPQQMTNIPLQSKLDIGSMVEIMNKHHAPEYGIIRWIGFVRDTDKKIAGLELVSHLMITT
jgi:hypothetical protein